MNHIHLATELTLNETELFFRNYYFLHGNEDLTKPLSSDQAEGLIQAMKIPTEDQLRYVKDVLSEEQYIPVHSEVAVYKHLRYLPPFFHAHDFIEVIYVLTGQCTHYIHDGAYALNPGDVYIIPPGTQHAISNFSDNCLLINFLIRSSNFDQIFFNVLAEKDVIANFFSRCLHTKRSDAFLFFPTKDSSAIRDFVAYTYEEYNSQKRYNHRMVNSLISAFFILLLRDFEKDVIIGSSNIEKFDGNIILILNYIQNNSTTVTLSELSTVFHYSERHLGRLIHEHCGQTFSELLRSTRLKAAEKLLLASDLSIQNIAHMSGYPNISHFYRLFKLQYGLSPSEFRKNQERT